jgi:plastocyanin
MAVSVVAALVPLVLPVSGAVAAPPDRTVRVFDFGFDPASLDVEAGDTVVWVLDQAASGPHQITLDADGNGDFDDDNNGEFDLSSADLAPNSTLRHTFDQAGKYSYFCKYHLVSQGMAGTVQVAAPPTTTTTEPPTTTTTAPPATTTTTAPAPPPPPPTTTTTRPRSTTTTAPASTPTTQPPASTSNDKPATTDTTARATTTTGKATTTTAKKKPGTTTTKPPETTTTSAPPALPAEWIPTPDMVPDGSPTTTTTAAPLQAAANHQPKNPKGGGSGLPIAAGGAAGVLLLGALGWAWYHRSSRYLPA